MPIKVKCQYCWKSFEVPDDYAANTVKCEFCERNTPVKMATGKKGEGTSNLAKMLAQDDELKKGPAFANFNLIIAVIVLCVLNLVVTLFGGFQRSATTGTDKTPEWGKQIEDQVTKLENQVDQLANALKAISKKSGEADEEKIDLVKVSQYCVTEMGEEVRIKLQPTFQLIMDEIKNLKDSIGALKGEMNNTKSEMIKGLEKLKNKN